MTTALTLLRDRLKEEARKEWWKQVLLLINDTTAREELTLMQLRQLRHTPTSASNVIRQHRLRKPQAASTKVLRNQKALG
jgi:hypothetical protein